MTVDTSRPAVEALIAEHEMLWARGAYINVSLANQIEQTLAALLDERDRLAANRDAWVSDAMTSTTELEQRIRDLEAERDGLEDSLSARDVELQQRALRIRDLEFQNESLAGQVHHLESARDDVRIALLQRAECAEAELLHARGISEIRGAERDRLKSRADNSLRAVRDVAAKLDAVKAALNASYHEPTNRVWHEQMQRLRAILADTDEPALACKHRTARVKFDGGLRSVVCNECDTIITRLADTDEGNSK